MRTALVRARCYDRWADVQEHHKNTVLRRNGIDTHWLYYVLMIQQYWRMLTGEQMLPRLGTPYEVAEQLTQRYSGTASCLIPTKLKCGATMRKAAFLRANLLVLPVPRGGGIRIEQRREDRTYVSRHRSREGDGRGVSGLLPPSRWQLGKNRAARRETERGKYSVWEKRRVDGRKSDARKKRHRRIRRAAQKIRTAARAGSRAGKLIAGTYNVRTLAFKGTNGIGHAEVILKTCKDAGCDIIGLQEVRRNEQSAFTAAGYVVFCSGADGETHEKKGNHGVGLAVRESIVAGMDKGEVAVECISARLMKVASNSNGNLTVCLSL